MRLLHDALVYIGIVAGCTVLVDYLRLRHAEYVDARAAKAQAALGSHDKPTTKCCDAFCPALSSALCEDQRCHYHCWLSCRCKGNQ